MCHQLGVDLSIVDLVHLEPILVGLKTVEVNCYGKLAMAVNCYGKPNVLFLYHFLRLNVQFYGLVLIWALCRSEKEAAFPMCQSSKAT